VNHSADPKIYNLDQFLTFLALGKTFFIFRLIPHLTAVKSNASKKLYDLNGVPIDNSLFVRVQLKEQPLMILGGSLLLCTIIFGFGMQIFERAIGVQSSYDKFIDVANSMWIVILGITTVGYGDISPVTHISRIITALGCFIGNVILILMTVVISNMINHNEKELKAYSFISNFNHRYILRDHAVVLIQRYYKYNMNFVHKKEHKMDNHEKILGHQEPK
jgi:hypothetical protein